MDSEWVAWKSGTILNQSVGNGGPNWKFEERKYYKELDSEWSYVNRSRRSVFDRIQFGSSSSATVPVASVFSCLKFPTVTPSAGSEEIQIPINSGYEEFNRPSFAQQTETET